MNIGIFSNKKAVETIKTVAIILLFAAMLGLFVYYTELQLGDLGVSGISRADKFPTDKMWVFSGNVNHALLSESASQFVCPASITFVNDASTFSVSPQKSALVTVYNDMVQYISEVLSPLYTAEDVSYDDYCNVVKSKNYTIISYNNDISAYILRLYCDKNAKGFYSGNSALIKRIMLTEDDHGRLVAYGISTDCKVMYFHPVSEAQAAAYPVNSAVISAYNSSNILVPSLLSFQSEFFSLPTTQASPDITFIPELQFYEAGISNPMSFIEKLTAQDSLIKNDRILSILKSFKINTGIVRHYADGNSLYFVESNALLEMSADGYIRYDGEDGGIPLSEILGRESEKFSLSDKMTAAAVLIGEFGNDIIGGNGEVMMSDVSYSAESGISAFEFVYAFDSVPFYGLDKIRVEIDDSSICRAYIPAYSIYRNSVRKNRLIAPEIAFNATRIPENAYVSDYAVRYVVDKNGVTANAGWVAVM